MSGLQDLLSRVWVNDFAPFMNVITALAGKFVSLMTIYPSMAVIIACVGLYLITKDKRRAFHDYYRRNRPWSPGKVVVALIRFTLRSGAIIMALDITALMFISVVENVWPGWSWEVCYHVWTVVERRCLLALVGQPRVLVRAVVFVMYQL
jgi:hypothetical protein